MKYFLIAGEASGDLHASHLMQHLKAADPSADFQYYGGDLMQAEGGKLLCHYKELAYMGFIPVLLHARTILNGLSKCKEAIKSWNPDAVILIDYPGFNLKVARYVRAENICPVFYYISPKIWAWKEYRIKAIRRDVDRLFSILPFEVDFFEKKHHYPISYVGNPTVDEVKQFHPSALKELEDDKAEHIALLPGSRVQEIKDNLSRMIQAALPCCDADRKLVVCVAPSVELEIYHQIIGKELIETGKVTLIAGRTYDVLSRSIAALVTSGTATLETALFKVPQIVCYYVPCGRFISFLRKHLLKVPFISLVNLICNRSVVPELVADGMTAENVRRHLLEILPGGKKREEMLRGYDEMEQRLGEAGAPKRAAAEMVELLLKH